jgi:TetR/AcrR family transcriptional repressor of mexJK operon
MNYDVLEPPLGLQPLETEVGAKAAMVLRAARKVFFLHGFSAATTDMIQREAGVSKSTVYAHFVNKERLFVAVIEAECNASRRLINDIQFSPGEMKRVLRELATAYLKVVLSAHQLNFLRVVISEGVRFPKLSEAFYIAGPGTSLSKFSAYLAEAASRGEIDLGTTTAAEAAKVFVSLVRSESQLYTMMHMQTPPTQNELSRWTEVAVDAFIRAFKIS